MTAPARLRLLLPWLNGAFDEDHYEGRHPEPVAVRTDFAGIRSAVAAFVASFDGSADAGHLEVIKRPFPDPTNDELEALGARLRILVAQGFGDGLLGDLSDLSFPATALRFAVRGAGRRKPGKEEGVSAQRDYRAAGAYVLQVQGPLLELVPFLAAHVLMAPDTVAVRRCKRPGCEGFLITATAARGRRPDYCSVSCRVRHAEQRDHQRATRRRNKL